MPRKLVTFCVLSLCLADSSGLEDNNNADSMLLGKLQQISVQSRDQGIDYSKTSKVRRSFSKGETSNAETEDSEEVTKASANKQLDSKRGKSLKEDFKTVHHTDESSDELHQVLVDLNNPDKHSEKLRAFLTAALKFRTERNKLGQISDTFHHIKDDDNLHHDFKSSPVLITNDMKETNDATNQGNDNSGLEDEETSREYGEYYEGDMIIEKERVRNSALHTNYWVNGVVPFDFDTHFPQEDRKKVLKAINYLNHLTCLHFRKHWYFLDGPHYVKITNSKPGCFATVGKPTKGAGKVNLGSSCMKKEGIVIHELLHSIGLFHEHSRHDRDQYVKIHWENIKPSDQHNFIMRNNFQVANIPYDYYSIMHYSTHAYTKNGLPTLEPTKSADARMMGQRDFVTKSDLAKVKSLYCR